MRSLPETTWLAVWPFITLALCARAPGQELRPRTILKGPQSPVYCIAVSPDGKSLASGTRDGQVVRWDVGAGVPKWARHAHEDERTGYTQVRSVAFSPDGRILASGGWDLTVRLWDAANGAPKRTLRHENLVYSVAFWGMATIRGKMGHCLHEFFTMKPPRARVAGSAAWDEG
jgi:WD40 repeat protein